MQRNGEQNSSYQRLGWKEKGTGEVVLMDTGCRCRGKKVSDVLEHSRTTVVNNDVFLLLKKDILQIMKRDEQDRLKLSFF